MEVRDVFWSACLEAWEGSTEVAVGEAESAERRLSSDGRISSGLSGLSLSDGACMPPPSHVGVTEGAQGTVNLPCSVLRAMIAGLRVCT